MKGLKNGQKIIEKNVLNIKKNGEKIIEKDIIKLG